MCKSPEQDRRTQRLAAKLKENLRRRKAQIRARAAGDNVGANKSDVCRKSDKLDDH